MDGASGGDDSTGGATAVIARARADASVENSRNQAAWSSSGGTGVASEARSRARRLTASSRR